MADLAITDADLAAAVQRLRETGAPVTDAACIASAVTGSEVVAAALDETDSLVRHIADALSSVALGAATDPDAIAAAMSDADWSLAGRAG